jgi:hypothetical protein
MEHRRSPGQASLEGFGEKLRLILVRRFDAPVKLERDNKIALAFTGDIGDGVTMRSVFHLGAFSREDLVYKIRGVKTSCSTKRDEGQESFRDFMQGLGGSSCDIIVNPRTGAARSVEIAIDHCVRERDRFLGAFFCWNLSNLV